MVAKPQRLKFQMIFTAYVTLNKLTNNGNKPRHDVNGLWLKTTEPTNYTNLRRNKP